MKRRLPLMSKYALVRESTDECEWEYSVYSDGVSCTLYGTLALVNTEMQSDPDYPEGFHEMHLCARHGALQLQAIERTMDRAWVEPRPQEDF